MPKENVFRGMENIANNNLLNSGQLNLPEVRFLARMYGGREKVAVPVLTFVMKMLEYAQNLFLSFYFLILYCKLLPDTTYN